MISITTGMVLLLMIAYSVLVLVIGGYAFKQTGKGRLEYYLAGGKLGSIVTFFTYLATFISTYGFIGLSAIYYSSGIEWFWFEAIAYPTVIIPLTIVIGLRLYKLGKMHNYITNADLVAHRLGSEIPIRIFFGLIMILFPSIFYIGIQLIAMSSILSGLTGGELSYTFVLSFFAAVMTLYIIFGGMRSVAYTDVFQGITMLLLLVVTVVLVYVHWGGFGEMFLEAGTGCRAGAFDRTMPLQYFYSALLLMTPAWAGLVPHLWVRFYAARNIQSVTAAGLGAGIGGMLMYSFAPLIVGTALLAYYPEAPQVAVTEQYVSMMFADWIGVIPAALLMFGLVAAGKSTADSILLNLSSILQVDILEKTFKVKWSERKLDLAARLMCVVVILIAAIAAFTPELPIVSIAISVVWPGLAVIGIPVIIMLFWRRVNKYGGLAGFISGFVSLLLFMYVIWPEWPHNPFYLWEGALPVLISIFTLVVVSLLTPPPPKELIENFYGKDTPKTFATRQ